MLIIKKEEKLNLEQIANELYEKHKKVFENWQEGKIKKIWIDEDNSICIMYESGEWWHYNKKGEWY